MGKYFPTGKQKHFFTINISKNRHIKYNINISRSPLWLSSKVCDLETQCLSATGSSGFFRGSVLWQGLSEPKLTTIETQGLHEYVNVCHDMTELMLKGT